MFQTLARRLADAGVTPNAISTSSIAFGFAAGAALATTAYVEPGAWRHLAWLAAAACVQLRLIANLLDGLVAVEGGRGTPIGDLFNEVPDRVSDTAILLGAGFASGSEPWLGVAAALGAMFVAYVRAIGASVGVGQAFLGPMAKQHRMAIVTAIAVWNATPLSPWTEPYPLMTWALGLITLGTLATAVRRLRWIASRLSSAVDS